MPSDNSFTITKHITSCLQCEYHTIRQIYTPDSFEHEEGLYCKLVEDHTESWVRHTYGGPTYYRLVVADEWDVRRYADIPDWCPRLHSDPDRPQPVPSQA